MPTPLRQPRRAAMSLIVLASIAAALLLPALARGHGSGIPWIYVEAEQVWPGEPFHVLVLDVAPYVTVQLQAELGDRTATLGEVATGAQGHGEADVALPTDFPFGHAQLRGIGDDGSEVDSPLRVGDVPAIDSPVGPQAPGPQPPSSALADPSIWTLGLIVGGALLAAGWMALRRRQAHLPAPVPVAEGRPPRAGRQRKSSGRRRRPAG